MTADEDNYLLYYICRIQKRIHLNMQGSPRGTNRRLSCSYVTRLKDEKEKHDQALLVPVTSTISNTNDTSDQLSTLQKFIETLRANKHERSSQNEKEMEEEFIKKCTSQEIDPKAMNVYFSNQRRGHQSKLLGFLENYEKAEATRIGKARRAAILRGFKIRFRLSEALAAIDEQETSLKKNCLKPKTSAHLRKKRAKSSATSTKTRYSTEGLSESKCLQEGQLSRRVSVYQHRPSSQDNSNNDDEFQQSIGTLCHDEVSQILETVNLHSMLNRRQSVVSQTPKIQRRRMSIATDILSVPGQAGFKGRNLRRKSVAIAALSPFLTKNAWTVPLPRRASSPQITTTMGKIEENSSRRNQTISPQNNEAAEVVISSPRSISSPRTSRTYKITEKLNEQDDNTIGSTLRNKDVGPQEKDEFESWGRMKTCKYSYQITDCPNNVDVDMLKKSSPAYKKVQ